MADSRIFNIERFAVKDGKGIRTVVFLKGCSMRCKWCANPESQLFNPEILVKNSACTLCGKCESVCQQKAISYKEGFGFITDHEKCNMCARCVEHCVFNAREYMGKIYTPKELCNELMRDAEYYRVSGGGVTFSGGEPLLHTDYILETKSILKEENINVLIETCGHVQLDNVKRISNEAEYIFYDIKHMSSEKHKRLTGVGNELILNNLQWLSENYNGELCIRYPYIPGHNDGVEEMRSFYNYVLGLKNISKVYVLPYHRLGASKYTGIGRVYPMGDMPSLKNLQVMPAIAMGREFGLDVECG